MRWFFTLLLVALPCAAQLFPPAAGGGGGATMCSGLSDASVFCSGTNASGLTGTVAAARLPQAAADGTTLGIASFLAADFNAAAGVVSLDYANAQKATGSVPGFLSSADWTTFNSKGTGTVTSVAAGCGHGFTTITVTGTINARETVNTQTGTTYTYLDGDCGKLVTHTNASAIAGTLPQANGSTFVAGWYMDVQNRGVGTLTITPTTSTIDDAATLALTTNQGVRIVSDGTNYFTVRGIGGATFSTGILYGPTPLGLNGATGCLPYFISMGVPGCDATNFGYLTTSLGTPVTPTVVKTCPSGMCATSWTYAVKAFSLVGPGPVSATSVAVTNNATLDGTHFNTVTTTAVAESAYCVLYSDGGGIVGGPIVPVGQAACGTVFTDNGALPLQTNEGSGYCCDAGASALNQSQGIYNLHAGRFDNGIIVDPAGAYPYAFDDPATFKFFVSSETTTLNFPLTATADGAGFTVNSIVFNNFNNVTKLTTVGAINGVISHNLNDGTSSLDDWYVISGITGSTLIDLCPSAASILADCGAANTITLGKSSMIYDATPSSGITQLNIRAGAGDDTADSAVRILLNNGSIANASIHYDGLFVSANGFVTSGLGAAIGAGGTGSILGMGMATGGSIFFSSDNTWYGTPDTSLDRPSAGLINVGNGTHGNAAGGMAMALLTVTGANVTLSGLGTATGTPDSVCLNTNTLKRNAALTCTVSSRDYKTAIGDITEGAADLLMELHPVEFAYNDHADRMRFGFISEEVAEVHPRLADGYDAGGVARSLDQNAILAVIVKVVQEQQKEIEALKAK